LLALPFSARLCGVGGPSRGWTCQGHPEALTMLARLSALAEGMDLYGVAGIIPPWMSLAVSGLRPMASTMLARLSAPSLMLAEGMDLYGVAGIIPPWMSLAVSGLRPMASTMLARLS